MVKKYSSKTSYGLLIFIFLVFFAPLIPNLIYNSFNNKVLIVIVLLIIFFGFILHLFFKTEYIIDNKKLKIRCGIFSYKPIEIEDIKEISKTNSQISSPAPSFDRIEIKYGKFDSIIISPKDKSKFVNDLTIINPDIRNYITEK